MELLRDGDRIVLGGEVKDADGFERLFHELGIRGDRFIVKPNWFSAHPGMPTESDVLDMVLSVLPGEKLVIEGYSGMRNDGSRKPQSASERQRWTRDQDLWFRQHYGLQNVIERHGARYLSVTEEVWRKRVVPAEEVAASVGAHRTAVSQSKLFGYVPAALWAWRGAPLISLGRVKPPMSLSTKNLFGLIPDPLRGRWHGAGDSNLAQSISDIATLYSALFDVSGVAEAVHSAVVYASDGKHSAPWGRWDLAPEPGIVFAGRPTTLLDAVIAHLVGSPPEAQPWLKLWPAAVQAHLPTGWRERLTARSG